MVWLLALACAVSASLHLWVVVPRLPPPPVEPGDPVPDYRSLATPGAGACVALVAAAAALLVGVRPWPELAPWVGYLGAGAALVWVDLRTTYLPRLLNHVAGAQVAVGVAVSAMVDPSRAAGAALGAVAALLLFHLWWRVSGSFGYGDVRLAGLVGAMGGWMGADGWATSFVLGTGVGALWGITHTLLRRRSDAPAHFAYGPALWLGPVLASVWVA